MGGKKKESAKAYPVKVLATALKMQKEEIINALRNDMPTLKARYGVQSIGLFGSTARGKNTTDSDLDFLVEVSAPLSENFFGLWDFLESRFQRKIDLVRKGDHLGQKFLSNVAEDIIYA